MSNYIYVGSLAPTGNKNIRGEIKLPDNLEDMMPKYKSNHDLPDTVKEHLPEHAQDIYREAFNSAWEQYDQPEERYAGRTREETAHAVAWSAVEKKYHKDDNGAWVSND